MPPPSAADTLPGFDAFVATPWGKILLATLDDAMPPGGSAQDRQMVAYEALAAYEPRDSVEQMLAVQAIAAHFATMACFRQAIQPDTDARTADRARGGAAAMARTMRNPMRTMAQRRRQNEATPQPEQKPKPAEINILNGNPERDWMSRRYAPEDDAEGDYAEAVRQSATQAEAGGIAKSRTV